MTSEELFCFTITLLWAQHVVNFFRWKSLSEEEHDVLWNIAAEWKIMKQEKQELNSEFKSQWNYFMQVSFKSSLYERVK